MPDYRLRLYTNALKTLAFVEDVTAIAEAYQHTIRLQGGYWRATFDLRLPLADLARWFYSHLGYHFEETSGGVKTWEGLVYEMTLNAGGVSRRRSLDDMYNHVIANYTAADSSSSLPTSDATQAQSIDRYGRREERIDMDNFDLTPAEARRDTYLKVNAWPWARPVSGGMTDPEQDPTPSLSVTCLGYIFTGNWRYVSAALLTDGDTTINAFIGDIVDTDCEYLNKGALAANTTAIKATLDIDQRAFDTISDMVELGDASGNFYAAGVYNERYFEYKQMSNAPRYYVMGNRIMHSAGDAQAVNPWTVKPGVFRDQEYVVGRAEQGSWFADARDFLAEEITVGARSGLSWRAADVDEADQLAALQEYQEWVSRQEEGGDGGDSAPQHTAWWEAGTTMREWERMTPAQRRARRKWWKSLSPSQRHKIRREQRRK